MKQNILGENKRSSFDDNLANVVNEIYDKMPDEIPETEVSENDSEQDLEHNKTKEYSGFFIEEFSDSYKLNKVLYNGDLCSFVWDKKLLDGGNDHTQNDWVRITAKLPDISVYFATFLALYENKDGPQAGLIEKIKQMFAIDFMKDMMTSTRVNYKAYNAKSKDEVIHDYSRNPNGVAVDFCGPDRYLNSQKLGVEMEALLGTSDCEKVDKVFRWITGKQTYLSRINVKPSSEKECALVLGDSTITYGFSKVITSNIIRIYTECGTKNSYLARGVVVVK